MSSRNSAKSLHPSLKSERLSPRRTVSLTRYRPPDKIGERALRSGWQIGQEGDTPRGPFIYFLSEGHPGTVIEMAEATPVRMRIFDQVREAALNWDRRDPIRMNWPQG